MGDCSFARGTQAHKHASTNKHPPELVDEFTFTQQLQVAGHHRLQKGSTAAVVVRQQRCVYLGTLDRRHVKVSRDSTTSLSWPAMHCLINSTWTHKHLRNAPNNPAQHNTNQPPNTHLLSLSRQDLAFVSSPVDLKHVRVLFGAAKASTAAVDARAGKRPDKQPAAAAAATVAGVQSQRLLDVAAHGGSGDGSGGAVPTQGKRVTPAAGWLQQQTTCACSCPNCPHAVARWRLWLVLVCTEASVRAAQNR